jgi:hypothetical protein
MIKYKYNLDEVEKILNELSSYKEKDKDLFFKEVSRFLHDFVMFQDNFLDLFLQSFAVNSDSMPAGTNEVTINYEPTSKLSNLLVALRASNW